MNVLQYGVMLECKNVFAFGIFLRIKETSSHQFEKAWLLTLHHGDSRDSGDTAPRAPLVILLTPRYCYHWLHWSGCHQRKGLWKCLSVTRRPRGPRCSVTCINWITEAQCSPLLPIYCVQQLDELQKGYFWFRLIAGDVPMIIVLITYYRIKKTLSLQGSLMSELMKHTISQSTMIFKAMEPKSQTTKVEPSPKQIQNQQKKRDLF